MPVSINGGGSISGIDQGLNITGIITATGGLNVTGGSVGIGTDNPSWGLDLQRNANTQARFIRNNAGDSYLRVNSHTGNIVGLQLGDNTDVDKQMIRADNTNNALIFNTANGEKLRITSSGNVGIGTDDPQNNLEICSDNNPYRKISINPLNPANTPASNGSNTRTIDFITNNTGSNVEIGAIRWINRDQFNDYTAASIASFNDGANSDGNLVFNIADAGTQAEALRISSGIGSVGIRTDDPKTNVDINLYTPAGNTYRGTVKINQFGHILQQNNQNVVTSGVSSYWALAPRDDGNFDISFDEPDANYNIVNSIVTFTSSGNVSIPNGNLAFASGNGIDFSATGDSSGTMTSELLDDYEEGTFTMTMSCGGNTASQECRYTKIGRIVYIDGHGDEVTNNFFNTGSQAVDTAATITTNLPFTPVRTGAAPITVSRTLKGANGFDYERMYVGWRKDSATIYLASESNDYYPLDNVVTSNGQTNKTILFSGHFVTEV